MSLLEARGNISISLLIQEFLGERVVFNHLSHCMIPSHYMGENGPWLFVCACAHAIVVNGCKESKISCRARLAVAMECAFECTREKKGEIDVRVLQEKTFLLSHMVKDRPRRFNRTRCVRVLVVLHSSPPHLFSFHVQFLDTHRAFIWCKREFKARGHLHGAREGRMRHLSHIYSKVSDGKGGCIEDMHYLPFPCEHAAGESLGLQYV